MTKTMTLLVNPNGAFVRLMMAAFLVMGMLLSPAGAQDKERLGSSRHLALDPVVVSVLGHMRVQGLLSVDVGLELARSGDRTQVERLMPRLRDRYVSALTFLARNQFDVDRPVDLDAVHAVLQLATDQTLGEDRAMVMVVGATVRRL